MAIIVGYIVLLSTVLLYGEDYKPTGLNLTPSDTTQTHTPLHQSGLVT